MKTLLRIALTGGIASGKSHCLAKFGNLGIPAVDADEIAHAAVEPGTLALAAVVARFGAHVLTSSGALDRDAVASIVFSDAAARHDLETIIHPVVYATIERWFTQLTEWSGARLGMADIPLLYETRHEADFDRVIVVTCRPEQQLERLIARGSTEEAARRRIAAQMALVDKVARANDVIDASGSREDTDRQVAKVAAALKALVS